MMITPSIPPAFVWKICSQAAGSMPGSGMYVPSIYTRSAPSVNQMHLLTSSALASAEKLRLAANCSSAETIVLAPKLPSYSSDRALSAGFSTKNGNDARHSQDGLKPRYRRNLERSAHFTDL